MTNGAPGSLLRVADLSRESMLGLLDRAEWLRANPADWPSFARKSVGLFFLQPSTRTRLGFTAAAQRLGCGTACLSEVRFTEGMSAAETLEDAVRSVSGYFSVIVLRHADPASVTAVATCAGAAVVNAGSGADEHPTQALIDLFALRSVRHDLAGLRIGIVGDLAGSRAARSLLQALSHFSPAEVRLISPQDRRLPAEFRGELRFPTCESERLCLERLDAVYVAGLPEGTGEERLGEDVRTRFRLTPETARALPGDAVILCPLPRIDEIDHALDSDPRARYFTQSQDGLFVRAAVLERALTACMYPRVDLLGYTIHSAHRAHVPTHFHPSPSFARSPR